MKNKPFTLHIMLDDPAVEPLKVILPNDGTTGLVIGEDHEVRYLYELIGKYLQTHKHDGEIPDYHEQLGVRWLTAPEAETFAIEQGYTVNTRTIRWAAAHGFIKGADKHGRDWRFPQRTFLHWLNHRPKPGRK
jgi:hypothetical protein